MNKKRWFQEITDEAYGLTIKVDREIVRLKTDYQTLEIFENNVFGKVMTLDDVVMLTEKDEFTYHEMLVHPGMLAHPKPEHVLIIGGGDGGTLREVVKHSEVKEAWLCEIDEAVINMSKKHLPDVSQGFDSPKARLHVGDGIEFVRNHADSFDVVIIDSTDPVGFAEGLFRAPFYRGCLKALKEGGIFIQQTESPFYQMLPWRRIFKELNDVFKNVHCYYAGVPMYPSGFWTFALASNTRDNIGDFDKDRAEALAGLRYYTPDMQKAAFSLPRFMVEELKPYVSKPWPIV